MMLLFEYLHQIHSTLPGLQPAFIRAGDKIRIGVHVLGHLLVLLLGFGFHRAVLFLVIIQFVYHLEPRVVQIPPVELASCRFKGEFHFGEGNHRRKLFNLASERQYER